VSPRVTWPSPPIATSLPFLMHSIVVARNGGPVYSIIVVVLLSLLSSMRPFEI